MSAPATTVVRAKHIRIALIILALTFTAAALLAAWIAEHALADSSVDLGVLRLRLGYNPGVAFSLGAHLPAPVVLTLTGLTTGGIGVYVWRIAPTTPLAGRIGLAGVVGGALANLVDRGVDGVVTDYLHTGWFPAFNLPDVLITCGGLVVVVATWRDSGGQRQSWRSPRKASRAVAPEVVDS